MKRILCVVALLAGLVPQGGSAMPEGISHQWFVDWTTPTGPGTAETHRLIATRYADGNDEIVARHAPGFDCHPASSDIQVAGVWLNRELDSCDVDPNTIQEFSFYGPSSFFTAIDPLTERIAGSFDGFTFDLTFTAGFDVSTAGLGYGGGCPPRPGAGVATEPRPQDASGHAFNDPIGSRYFAYTGEWAQACAPVAL